MTVAFPGHLDGLEEISSFVIAAQVLLYDDLVYRHTDHHVNVFQGKIQSLKIANEEKPSTSSWRMLGHFKLMKILFKQMKKSGSINYTHVTSKW